MSESNSFPNALHAYHDGELGWWARRRFERELSRSAGLREELESLRQLTDLTAESEDPTVLPLGAIWEGIEGRLRAVDAGIEAEGPVAMRADSAPGPASWASWRPFGAAALAAASAVALFLVLRPATGPVGEGVIANGTVRYLDAGERSVIVNEQDDVTIIWVMGGAEDV